MNYYRITDGSEDIPGNLLAVSLRCLHDSNPDFEDLYPNVSYWYVEVDTEQLGAVREIGFTDDGVPIVLGPYGNNPGLWINLALAIYGDEDEQITRQDFEKHWCALAAQQ